MREVARIIDGVFTLDGVAPHEVHHHHVHHVHHHAPAPVQQPVQQERRTTIAPRLDTVDQIKATLADIVRAARELDEDDQRRIYDVMHGSLSLVSAMIKLDHRNKTGFDSALRRKT